MIVRTLYLPFSFSNLLINENTKHPLVLKVQHLLQLLHMYQGAANSIYDEETMEAVTKFQEKENLVPTGQLDPITLCRLNQAKHIEIMPRAKRVQHDFSLPRANILIAKSKRELTLFNGNTPLHQYPVGIGKPATPTPLGNYSIALKNMNPGGILGSRWLGLNYGSYGIHGTSQPWLIGQMVSHGCVRMHNHHVEELFTLVRIGTPVYIRD